MKRRLSLLLLTLASGCISQSVTSYPVGGTVSGLTGVLTLQDNAFDILKVSSNGTYAFGSLVQQGLSYSVSVLVQPSGQSCTVNNATGTVGGGAVTNVDVTCSDLPSTGFNLGGLVEGLATGSGEVVLIDNISGNIADVTSNGAFAFPTPIDGGASYQVSVKTQPGGLLCSVTNGTGTVLDADVTNIVVICSGASTLSYPVGGTLTGLASGSTVTLQNNGQENIALSGNGNFIFMTTLSNSQAYNVTVLAQPDSSHTCSVQNGSGVMGTAAVTNIVVTCGPGIYSVSGDVTGLISQTIVVQNSNTESIALTGTGNASDVLPFAFSDPLGTGSPYDVEIPQSPGVNCAFSGDPHQGSISNANIVIHIACQLDVYSIGGTIVGLSNGQQIGLVNNSGDPLNMNSTGTASIAFDFDTPLPTGSTYSVSVAAAPPGLACSVTNGTGTVGNANVTDVQVSCATGYSVGGLVNGANGSGEVVALTADNGNQTINLVTGTSVPFQFSQLLAPGDNYTVTMQTPPTGQQCVVFNGSGTIGSTDVTNVVINCATPLVFDQNSTASSVVGQASFTNATNPTTTASSLQSPQGNPIVLSAGAYFPDTGANRVVVFSSLPTSPGANANFVMGQPNFTSNGNDVSQFAFTQPASVASDGNIFAVADMGASRVLGYTSPPSAGNADDPNAVLGQPDFNTDDIACGPTSFTNPNSVFIGAGWMLVADTANSRVLGYNITPDPNGNLKPVTGQTPDLVLGVGSANSCSASSLAAPTDAWTDGVRILVVDASTSALHVWNSWPANGQAPDLTLGGVEGTGANQFHTPTYVASNGIQIFVADTGNNRVAVFNQFPTVNNTPADVLLGQPAAGPTACTACAAATSGSLCCPRGVAVANGNLIVMDTGNNRALIF